MLHLGMGILYIRTNGSLGCKINNIILIEKKIWSSLSSFTSSHSFSSQSLFSLSLPIVEAPCSSHAAQSLSFPLPFFPLQDSCFGWICGSDAAFEEFKTVLRELALLLEPPLRAELKLRWRPGLAQWYKPLMRPPKGLKWKRKKKKKKKKPPKI